nr:constitutive coactivator of PPAR-gamma-like protein 2 [Salvelinus alpinus]
MGNMPLHHPHHPHHHPHHPHHHPAQHRPRGFPGLQSIPPQGGKLEIAGMVVGQWAGNKPLRGRGGFNMQVVSVGAGSGRGKDIPVKAGRGVKKTHSPSSTSPTKPEEEEPNSGAVTQQLNGSPAASAIGQPLDLPPLAHPIPCALASRDNQTEEAPCCLDDCPSDGTLTKEA